MKAGTGAGTEIIGFETGGTEKDSFRHRIIHDRVT